MRYYLDTNIVIFLLRDRAELCPDVRQLVYDYANELLTSSVCVQDLIHLCQIGKFDHDRHSKRLRADEVLDMVSEAGVGIVPVDMSHLRSQTTMQASMPDNSTRLLRTSTDSRRRNSESKAYILSGKRLDSETVTALPTARQ